MHLEQPSPPLPTLDPSPEPRLGILHLLVWTACVALELGLLRLLCNAFETPAFASVAVYIFVHGVGGGTAFAGLALLVARSRHKIPFPVYPGEYLLVVLGGDVVIAWMMIGVMALLEATRGMRPFLAFLVIIALVASLALALWPLTRRWTRRWAAWFWVFLVATVLSCGGPIPMVLPLAGPGAVLRGFGDIFLVNVVLRDRANGRRYPWTHWLGIGTELWLGLGNTIALVELLSLVFRRR